VALRLACHPQVKPAHVVVRLIAQRVGEQAHSN
jgi:hypothetical protein